MLTVYGIKTCDTVRKALKWLDAQGIPHTFHDVRADGLDAATCRRWVEALGWESVLNRRSTTWRNLPESDRKTLDADRVVHLLVAHPTLVKRPVFEEKSLIQLGFGDDSRARLSRKVTRI